MPALLVLLLVVLALVQQVSSSAPAAVLATVSATRRVGGKPAKLCVLFGFYGGGVGVGDELQLLGEEVVSVNAKSATDMLLLGGFDVAIGYVRASDALSAVHETRLLQNLVSLLEGMGASSSTVAALLQEKKIVFYVDGLAESGSAATALETEAKLSKISKRLTEVVREALALVFPDIAKSSSGQSAYPEVRIESSIEAVAAVVGSVKASRTGEQIASGIDTSLVSASATKLGTTTTSTFSIQAKAAVACQGISDDFVGEVQASVAVLGGTATVDEVCAVVESAFDNFNREQEQVLRLYAGTAALKAAAYSVRSQLGRALEAPFRRFSDSIVSEALTEFESLSRKVLPDSQLAANLQKRAKSVLETAKKSSAQLHREFTNLVSRQGEGILQDPKIAAKFRRESAFSCANSLRQLETELNERCAERVRVLYLQGAYNPFIRDLPWAPTHVNINYLVDPRALALGLEYNKLYDEQVEGPVNRADPLWIRGVTKVAFDPNDHPVPKESKSWWQVLKDFYMSD